MATWISSGHFSCSPAWKAPEPISAALKSYLDAVADRYERIDFIRDDPVSVPHGFDDPRDRELIALYAALLAWGRRDILLRKLADLCERMHFAPRSFVEGFDPVRDAPALDGFVHRTFSSEDAVNLTIALSHALDRFGSLEALFAVGMDMADPGGDPAGRIRGGLENFSSTLIEAAPGDASRMRRVLARPSTGSACKRLNMYLRWMVRPGPVDLGIWNTPRPEELLLPLDVHSGRQARAVGLLERRSNDWKAAIELTRACRDMDPDDPARYDFAFFGAGSAGEELVPPGNGRDGPADGPDAAEADSEP